MFPNYLFRVLISISSLILYLSHTGIHRFRPLHRPLLLPLDREIVHRPHIDMVRMSCLNNITLFDY